MKKLIALLIVAALPVAASAIERTELQNYAFPKGFATHLMHVTIAAGENAPLHIHPGIEMGRIESGEMLLMIVGQPDRKLAAGESFVIPPATPHSVRNPGTVPLVVVSTYVVDPDKPLTMPVKQ